MFNNTSTSEKKGNVRKKSKCKKSKKGKKHVACFICKKSGHYLNKCPTGKEKETEIVALASNFLDNDVESEFDPLAHVALCPDMRDNGDQSV